MIFGKVEQKNYPNQPAYSSSLVMFCLLEKIVFESQGTEKEKVKTLAIPRRYISVFIAHMIPFNTTPFFYIVWGFFL